MMIESIDAEIQKHLDTVNACNQRFSKYGSEIGRQAAFLASATARLEALPYGAPGRGKRARALAKTIEQKTRKVDLLMKGRDAAHAEREAAEERIAELRAHLAEVEAERVRNAEKAATVDSAKDLAQVVEQTEAERNSKEALAEALGVDPATIKDVNLDEKF